MNSNKIEELPEMILFKEKLASKSQFFVNSSPYYRFHLNDEILYHPRTRSEQTESIKGKVLNYNPALPHQYKRLQIALYPCMTIKEIDPVCATPLNHKMLDKRKILFITKDNPLYEFLKLIDDDILITPTLLVGSKTHLRLSSNQYEWFEIQKIITISNRGFIYIGITENNEKIIHSKVFSDRGEPNLVFTHSLSQKSYDSLLNYKGEITI